MTSGVYERKPRPFYERRPMPLGVMIFRRRRIYGRAQHEAWEREQGDLIMPVVARCTQCGRGYIGIDKTAKWVTCQACGGSIVPLEQLPPK